jgi:hypothetical protein
MDAKPWAVGIRICGSPQATLSIRLSAGGGYAMDRTRRVSAGDGAGDPWRRRSSDARGSASSG